MLVRRARGAVHQELVDVRSPGLSWQMLKQKMKLRYPGCARWSDHRVLRRFEGLCLLNI